MHLIVAVDDRNGMMFNKRRQSRDQILCQKIISLIGNAKLWINHYSAPLFADCDNTGKILIDDEFLKKAGNCDFCFAENTLPDIDSIGKIILFKWNRKYPSDYYFNIDVTSWNMVETENFAGSSHENITMEVYTK